MRRSSLLGWIMPVILTAVIVYAAGVVTGRWPDPTARRDDAAARPAPLSGDPEQRRAQTELCPLINRPEVLDLIDHPATVTGTGTSYDPAQHSRLCWVSLRNGSLRLGVDRGRLRVADYRTLFRDARPRTVLGRPALWTAGPSLINASRWQDATLLVAWDRADSGGTVELTTVRDRLVPQDEAALRRIAERQLPGLPGWAR